MATIPRSAAQVREDFSETVRRVQAGHERVVIQRNGKPAAAIVSLEDLRALEALEDRLDIEASELALSEPERIPWKELRAKLGIGKAKARQAKGRKRRSA